MAERESRAGVPTPYLRVARFPSERSAGRVYTRAQGTIFRDPGCDLSVFRLILERRWHVAILGEQPREDLERQLMKLLSRGQPASLPEEILIEMQRRRAQAIRLGPWVERHQRPPNP